MIVQMRRRRPKSRQLPKIISVGVISVPIQDPWMRIYSTDRELSLFLSLAPRTSQHRACLCLSACWVKCRMNEQIFAALVRFPKSPQLEYPITPVHPSPRPGHLLGLGGLLAKTEMRRKKRVAPSSEHCSLIFTYTVHKSAPGISVTRKA